MLRPLLGYALAGIREFGPVPIGDLLLVVVGCCWLMMMLMMLMMMLLLLHVWQCSNGNALVPQVDVRVFRFRLNVDCVWSGHADY